jgi:hypothetical protein
LCNHVEHPPAGARLSAVQPARARLRGGTEQQSGRPARTQYRLTNFGEDEFFRLLRAQAWATEVPVDSFSPVLPLFGRCRATRSSGCCVIRSVGRARVPNNYGPQPRNSGSQRSLPTADHGWFRSITGSPPGWSKRMPTGRNTCSRALKEARSLDSQRQGERTSEFGWQLDESYHRQRGRSRTPARTRSRAAFAGHRPALPPAPADAAPAVPRRPSNAAVSAEP